MKTGAFESSFDAALNSIEKLKREPENIIKQIERIEKYFVALRCLYLSGIELSGEDYKPLIDFIEHELKVHLRQVYYS